MENYKIKNFKYKYIYYKYNLLIPIFVIIVSVFYISRNFLFNWSPSIPVGIYERAPHGHYIAFCAPEFISDRKYAPYAPAQCEHRPLLLKPVIAGPGDTVVTEKVGVWVFGKEGRFYKAEYIGKDSTGKPMPKAKEIIKLKGGEYYVLSTFNPRAIDSRYLGAIKEKEIKGVYNLIYAFK